ncbi:MAG: bifunctional DNA-formamidopyrimidine glycosylase/DNA-(apurinic or apyrimidinic site) lyase [Phycisphaerales bacterium]|nr:bifunctional DNA-formamidopyrimidine glycosylase/DNA-(apurinic or apyrimidinic site) lyase [Phycisphaerales bacterium]
MPELPEVESVRREIEGTIIGWTVAKVLVHRADIIETTNRSPHVLRKALLAVNTITGTLRHGKQLAILGASGAALRVHLGMTGALMIVDTPPTQHDRHTHVMWVLENGEDRRWLMFRDPRRFGSLRPFATQADLRAMWSTLGPDALTITATHLAAALNGRAKHIKAALLDQKLLAGVGNIYADEALHRAHLRPQRRCRTLTTDEIRDLALHIRVVLREAIRHGGSSIRDYRGTRGRSGSFQPRHRVYGRAGLPCLACNTPLRSTMVAQRTTVYCSRCQE